MILHAGTLAEIPEDDNHYSHTDRAATSGAKSSRLFGCLSVDKVRGRLCQSPS